MDLLFDEQVDNVIVCKSEYFYLRNIRDSLPDDAIKTMVCNMGMQHCLVTAGL